ncbi:MAG: oligoendopeptidase F [Bacteroidales bacterium]
MILLTLLAGGLDNLNAQSKIPDFSLTERKDIPKEYTWKIEDVFPDVDAWKREKEEAVTMIAQIDNMAKTWTSSAKAMLEFEQYTDKLSLKMERLYSYAGNQANMDVGNTQFISMKGEIQSLFVQYGSKLAFVQPDLLKLGEAKFKEYLKSEPKLETWRFGIEQVFRMKDHILPEDQQRIVSMTGLFSHVPGEASGVLNNLEIPSAEIALSDGKKVTLNYANYMQYRGAKDASDRSLVMKTFWDNHTKFENTHATLLNGEMKQHYFYSKVGKYQDCLEARLYGENIDPAVYHKLISSIHKNLPSLHQYLKLKQRMLKLKSYKYDDIYASAVAAVEKEYSYNEAVELVKNSMKPLGQEYQDVLNIAFSERWVDIYPNKGKESGAYSSGLYGVHPYIKMNYNGDYDAVSTLAHELGHAVHSYFSDKYQAYANANYATFLAEIASTFNENLLMTYLLENEKDDMFKLFILDNYLDGVRATIFRQTLFAEFELAMHQRVESGQSLTADWLNEKYLALTREFYGHGLGVMQVDEYIQNEWSNIPHFYMNYYVFQYSTGIIASMALSEMVLKQGATARDKYLEMLKSGGKDFPLTLLKKAGVDMTTEAPTQAAMANFDRLVGEMSKLVEKLQKEGKM